MSDRIEVSALTLDQLDAEAARALAHLDDASALDPVTAISIARLLFELYAEIRKRVG